MSLIGILDDDIEFRQTEMVKAIASLRTAVPSPEVAERNFQIAADDYEKILQLEEPTFSKLSVHARGELRGRLAEAWNGLGDVEKSRGYLRRMTEELAGATYGRRAKEALSSKSGALGTTCLGYHVAQMK